MLFKNAHKVSLAITNKICQIFNCQIFLVIAIDKVNEFTDFFVFPIGIISIFFDDIAMEIKEID